MKMKLLHVHEEHEEDYSKLTMFYCYAEFHEDSHRPLSRTQEKRHLQGIPFQTCCYETPLQLEESQTYLISKTGRLSIRRRGKKIDIAGVEQNSHGRTPNPRDDAYRGRSGSWVYTWHNNAADTPPATNDFWLPLFTHPITPPAARMPMGENKCLAFQRRNACFEHT